jgi:predicted RNA-binding Zn-ribbon protein involved in translation (DUF1610 family)
MSHKKTAEEFIRDSIKIHGEKYDYSQVVYVSSKHPVKIVCSEHGIFMQKPNTHLNTKKIHGCPKCGIKIRADKLRSNLSIFIEKAKKVFPHYDYSGVIFYTQNKEKINVTCSIHGLFTTNPNRILSHLGCPMCGYERISKLQSLSQEEFIERVTKTHKGKYDYSLTVYKKKDSLVKIICPIHGSFFQLAGNHLMGEGCKKCAVENEGLRKRKIVETSIISQFQKKHGNRYDYQKAIYQGNLKKIEIICKKHGSFWQAPANHRGGSGCPICRQSKGEAIILKWLKENNIEYVIQKRFKDCQDKRPLPFDFYLKDFNICIEYDGELHFKEYENSFKGTHKLATTNKHDEIKTMFCKEKNINLIRIPYWEKNNIEQILEKVVKL